MPQSSARRLWLGLDVTRPTCYVHAEGTGDWRSSGLLPAWYGIVEAADH